MSWKDKLLAHGEAERGEEVMTEPQAPATGHIQPFKAARFTNCCACGDGILKGDPAIWVRASCAEIRMGASPGIYCLDCDPRKEA